jgi:uncharacterized membrane protein
MPSKYDTNPLDPEFPDKAGATQAFGSVKTDHFPPPPPTEEQTRRFGQQEFDQYQQQAYVPQSPPVYYQYNSPDVGLTSKRKVSKIGVAENIVCAVPYIPWYFGMIAGIILLFLLPRTETKARFHAAQGLAVHVAILIVTSILGAVAQLAGLAQAANVIFQIVMTIMLIVWTIKAWRGKPVHIETVDSLTNWLDEKIDPKLVGNQ